MANPQRMSPRLANRGELFAGRELKRRQEFADAMFQPRGNQERLHMTRTHSSRSLNAVMCFIGHEFVTSTLNPLFCVCGFMRSAPQHHLRRQESTGK